MSERKRFSVIETGSNRNQSLEERPKDFPELRAKIERMLEVVENSAGDMKKAATVEERVTVELRQRGVSEAFWNFRIGSSQVCE